MMTTLPHLRDVLVLDFGVFFAELFVRRFVAELFLGLARLLGLGLGDRGLALSRERVRSCACPGKSPVSC
jgi:hypothetical protein